MNSMKSILTEDSSVETIILQFRDNVAFRELTSN